MAPMDEIINFLREALSYVLNVATSHYDRLTFLRYHIQDIVFGIEVVIQTYYLTQKHSTYSEGLYGFKRSKLASRAGATVREFSKFDVAVSLLIETVCPYLLKKLQSVLYQQSIDAAPDQQSRKQRWLRRLLKLLAIL